ncbi:methylation-associated defense system restriction endonuclease subunit S MAD5 [Mariniflexile sp. AS56]|uniref:methylation-associated defense system restriction endonuclease subunit S MAD5 n=1 Tax=Mariniflexile sp. AS56 TaxID=3063957 RepID=UPI0026F0C7EA|nr:restriction endonuclease subunit S [Mariniflexile sp. AS56]MDO7173886.1 restriction endonuclease subunit S [Mariniflexile sp. AS56]
MKSGFIKITRFMEGLTVLKPDYYLNRGKKTISDLLDKNIPFDFLSNLCGDIYQGGIFKRVFVNKVDFAFKYITASDMVKIAPLDTSKNISKKYTPWIERMKLKEGQILISCAGTVGNVAYVNNSFSGCIGSQEIIRVESSAISSGYLYAYLSSLTVNEYIQSMVYGAVIPRISPSELGRLPILIPSEHKQNEINRLIVDSSNLKYQSSLSIEKAISLFESKISKNNTQLGFQTGGVSSQTIDSFHKRLDGQYQLLWKSLSKEENSDLQYDKISSYASSIFVGGRGKRIYVEKGIPFLSSSEMMVYNSKRNCKNVSTKTNGLDSMLVNSKDILISRSGTVGNTILVGNDLNQTAVSEHALRLVIDPAKISPNYVFCFLRTKYGIRSMEASSFGSVIITLNEDLIGNINMPILSKSDQQKISELIEDYVLKLDQSIIKENQAIDLVEKEIEEWQK